MTPFKLPLVKKKWDIFITCQQKMGHLSNTRVFTKSILDIIPETISLAAPPYYNLA
jgi:hypothetical protein